MKPQPKLTGSPCSANLWAPLTEVPGITSHLSPFFILTCRETNLAPPSHRQDTRPEEVKGGWFGSQLCHLLEVTASGGGGIQTQVLH